MTRFTKGHGTENDFVLLPDPDGLRPLDPEGVRRLANRHAGLGGDGVIRVVRTSQSGEPTIQGLADRAEWFMDYRNADGSIAEMCGNGTRVFAAFLRREGWETRDEFQIATRAGLKHVRVEDDNRYAVDLGSWRLVDPVGAERDGFDVMVRVADGKPIPALRLDLGNPHTVVMLPEGIHLGALNLSEAPQINPEPEHGTNVEVVHAVGPAHISMRVHERGVGETRSCGTGAAAAALATMFWAGSMAEGQDWVVDVPGGRLQVRTRPEQHVELAGPAMLVADGETDLI